MVDGEQEEFFNSCLEGFLLPTGHSQDGWWSDRPKSNWKTVSYQVGQLQIEDDVADTYLREVKRWGFGDFKVGELFVQDDQVNMVRWWSIMCILRPLIEKPLVIKRWYDLLQKEDLDSWTTYVALHCPCWPTEFARDSWTDRTRSFPVHHLQPNHHHALFPWAVTALVDPKKTLEAYTEPTGWKRKDFLIFDIWAPKQHQDYKEYYTASPEKFKHYYDMLMANKV